MSTYAMVVVVSAPSEDDAHQQASRAGEALYVSNPQEVVAVDLGQGGYWTTIHRPVKPVTPDELDETVFVLHSDDGA
jgi:hypothetical protein